MVQCTGEKKAFSLFCYNFLLAAAKRKETELIQKKEKPFQGRFSKL
mgnify:CR=1 FL=1